MEQPVGNDFKALITMTESINMRTQTSFQERTLTLSRYLAKKNGRQYDTFEPYYISMTHWHLAAAVVAHRLPGAGCGKSVGHSSLSQVAHHSFHQE